MKTKLALLVGAAVGYVAGTAAGRQRFEQIKTKAQDVWTDPTVRDKVSQATDRATDAAVQATDKVKQATSSKPTDTPVTTTTTGPHV